MAYNPYGAPPRYGAPPGAFPGFPGSGTLPDMTPPGLGPPPGMSSAPGMAPPPGVQQPSSTQANRPSGLLSTFQPPANLPNINFSAPVIRLGTLSTGPLSASPTTSTPGGASRSGLGGHGGRHHHHHHQDSSMTAAGDRGSGRAEHRGTDRGDRGGGGRDAFGATSLAPLGIEDKLRTLFVHKIPDTLDDVAIEKLLSAVGALRRWDPASSVLEESKGTRFGFALFEDAESLSVAAELLDGIEIPVKKPMPTPEGPCGKDDTFGGIDKTKLQVAIDPKSQKFIDMQREYSDDEEGRRKNAARASLERTVLELFYPTLAAQDAEGDVAMTNSGIDDNVEVVNIPLAQEDELADIPAEMREVVAAEIAAFRERSNRRDLERIKREEELEETERLRAGRATRVESPGPEGVNNIPVKPRGAAPPPSGPRGHNGRGLAFVNGSSDLYLAAEEEDSDASDDEICRRHTEKQRAEDDKQYLEAERKWVNRERTRAAALARENDREAQAAENLERARQEQLGREATWDDEREASRKTHIYYRDHAAWLRKRMHDKAEEEARDEQDRRAEDEERRREQADLERAKGMADSFLDQQAQEITHREQLSEPAAPQPFKLSLGAAAAQRAQRAGPQRRTIAEVEGLLDDEETAEGVKRTLVPIQFEPISGTSRAAADMSDEEISAAIKSLASEIPSEKDGLWAWEVRWEYLDAGAVVREKLRPFVEKKIMEYLGVQEEMLVDVVEEHLKKKGKPGDLVEELQEALDDDAEDLVKKLWRMLIFFTECEKRGLPT